MSAFSRLIISRPLPSESTVPVNVVSVRVFVLIDPEALFTFVNIWIAELCGAPLMVDDCVPEPEIDGEINSPEESTETNQSFVFANVSPDAERVIVALPEPSVVAVRYL